jgi:hypothetical protein
MGTDNPMSKQDDYRAYAAELLDLASRAASTSDKGRLLAVAEAWLDLADRVHRVLCQQTEKLGHFASGQNLNGTRETLLRSALAGLTETAFVPNLPHLRGYRWQAANAPD